MNLSRYQQVLAVMRSNRNSIFCIHKNSHPLFSCYHTGVVPFAWQVSKWCQHIPCPGMHLWHHHVQSVQHNLVWAPLSYYHNVPPGQDVHYSMNQITQVTVSMSISCCTSEHARKLHAEHISRALFCRIGLISVKIKQNKKPRNAQHWNTAGICGTVSFVCPCLHNKYTAFSDQKQIRNPVQSAIYIYISQPVCSIFKLSLSIIHLPTVWRRHHSVNCASLLNEAWYLAHKFLSAEVTIGSIPILWSERQPIE